jgi:hypothetical protein
MPAAPALLDPVFHLSHAEPPTLLDVRYVGEDLAEIRYRMRATFAVTAWVSGELARTRQRIVRDATGRADPSRLPREQQEALRKRLQIAGTALAFGIEPFATRIASQAEHRALLGRIDGRWRLLDPFAGVTPALPTAPPEAEPPQPGRPVPPEPAGEPRGADSAEAAQRDLLLAAQIDDWTEVRRLLRVPGPAEEAVALGLLRAATIESFAVTEPAERITGRDVARLRFTWSVTLGAPQLELAILDAFGAISVDSRLTPAEAAVELTRLRVQLRRDAPLIADQLRQTEQTALLAKHDRRWFVIRIASPVDLWRASLDPAAARAADRAAPTPGSIR